MTPSWPAPAPAPAPQRASRPASDGLAVVVAILAMLVSWALVLMGLVGARAWLTALPTDGNPTGGLPPVEAPRTPGATARPTPQQTVGPVSVTDSIMRGVVLVTGTTPADAVAGTGMVLTPDGLVMTNYHVVRSTETLTVTVAATGRRYTATLVGRDATVDVALLQLTGARGLKPVVIDDDPVRVGDVVIAAGNANGQGYVTAHRGNILGLGRSIQVRGPVPEDPPETLTGLIETNAPAWPGDSGGPMFDADHEVLGMTTAGGTEDEEDKEVYAVPIAEALEVVDRIRAGDESGTIVIGPKSYLGIVAQADDADGLIITKVEPSTPAGRVGLQPDDRIISLDGRRVDSRLGLSRILDDITPGTPVEIEWESGGRRRTGTVTPAASPYN